MDIVTLIVQLLSGAAGGNIAGALLKNLSLGTLGNSLAGIVGGGVFGQLLQAWLNLPSLGAGVDPMTILSQVLSGGFGGGVALVIVGLLKSLLAKA